MYDDNSQGRRSCDCANCNWSKESILLVCLQCHVMQPGSKIKTCVHLKSSITTKLRLSFLQPEEDPRRTDVNFQDSQLFFVATANDTISPVALQVRYEVEEERKHYQSCHPGKHRRRDSAGWAVHPPFRGSCSFGNF